MLLSRCTVSNDVLCKPSRQTLGVSCGRAAFRECDELVAATPPGHQKIDALRVSAFISMRFGIIERAEDAFTSAKSLWSQYTTVDSSPSSEVAAACIDLLGAQLACYRGNAVQTFRMARRAANRLETLQANASTHVREIYAETLIELGSALCNLGDWERGHEELTNAQA
jgi:hypothetical protein